MLVLELISSAIHKGTDISDEHIALLLNNTRSAQDDQSCIDEDEEDKLQAVKNVLHYALLNKTSDKVIEDLSEEYLNLKSNVYRYIPLMFDIEMTFNEGYRSAASDTQCSHFKTII